MPLNDLGYRAWNGPLRRRWSLATVIAASGFSLAWKSNWLRRLLLAAWLPAAYLGIGIFAFEKSVEYPSWRSQVRGFVRELPNSSLIMAALKGRWARGFPEELQKARYKVWALILMTFFRYPQGVLVVPLVALIVPSLIVSDLRSRAYLLYFSRPLTILEYVIGRAATVWAYLLLITALPALALFAMGVLLSSDLRVLAYTWDLPLRILLASAVLLIPTTALAMGVASLFRENRNAVFAWFAIWILGWGIYANVTVAHAIAGENVPRGWWSLVSLYHVLGSVQLWIFGLSKPDLMPWKEILLLSVVTLVSIWILLRRVAAPLKV